MLCSYNGLIDEHIDTVAIVQCFTFGLTWRHTVPPLFFLVFYLANASMNQPLNRFNQGIRYGLVQVLGICVGMVSTIWLYGHVLEVYGTVQFFLSVSALLFPVASLGVYALNYRFFPLFENNDNGHHGFLPLLLAWGITGTLLCLLVVWPAWHFLQPLMGHQSDEIARHIGFLAPILLFTVLNFTLAHYAVNFGRMTFPALLNDLMVKLTVPALLLLYLGGVLDIEGVLYGLTGYFALASLALLLYARQFGKWRWLPDRQIVTKIRLRDMMRYGGYNTMTGLGLAVLSRLDLVVIGLMMSPGAIGAYAVAVAIAGAMEIPFKTVSTSAAPIISQYLHRQDNRGLSHFLQTSTFHLFFVALAMTGGVWLCSAELFGLMPARQLLDEAREALLVLAFVKLMDAAMGLNGYVLMLSRHFRHHFRIVAAMLCFHIVLLVLLIPRYGLTGAATATALASLLSNGLATLLVCRETGIHPFSSKMWGIGGVMLAAWAVTYMMTLGFQANFFALIFKGAIFLAIFSGLTFALRLTPQADRWRAGRENPSLKSER